MKETRILYCKKCIIPSTRPEIHFDNEGICSACNYSKKKIDINWQKRKAEFLKLVKHYKRISKIKKQSSEKKADKKADKKEEKNLKEDKAKYSEKV